MRGGVAPGIERHAARGLLARVPTAVPRRNADLKPIRHRLVHTGGAVARDTVGIEHGGDKDSNTSGNTHPAKAPAPRCGMVLPGIMIRAKHARKTRARSRMFRLEAVASP